MLFYKYKLLCFLAFILALVFCGSRIRALATDVKTPTNMAIVLNSSDNMMPSLSKYGNIIDIGDNWMFFGDSETAGRALEASVKSQVMAFTNIWNQTFSSSQSPFSNGVSGRKLQATLDYYSSVEDRGNATLVHFQESGSQDATQDTAEKYVDVFESMVRSIALNSPNAIISTETAYSFEAESMQGRDWTRHNILMRKKIDELSSEGIIVYLAEVDRNIRELVARKRSELGVTAGQEAVWGATGNSIGRHYTGLGNLMLAFGMYESLGYDIDTLDLSNIPLCDVSYEDKQLCIRIVKSMRTPE